MRKEINLPKLKKLARKHAPLIFDITSAATGILTVGLAWYGGLKSNDLLEEAKAEKDRQIAEETGTITTEGTELTLFEKAKVTVRYWVPPLITGTISLISGYFGAREIHKRNTALAASAAMSELALNNYISKTKELIGEKKEQKIRDSVIQQEVTEHPIEENTEVFIASSGQTLCYDNLSGRYFKSDMEQIRRALNNLNRILLRQDYISLNDFYDEIGLPRIETGDYLGWSNHGNSNYELGCRFSSHIASNGEPCLVVVFDDQPRYDYYK